MSRKTTGTWKRIVNALTGTGTTVTRTRDFWGRKKTVVRNYDTGTTKEYTHGCGFWGNKTKVEVRQGGAEVGSGTFYDHGRHGAYEGTCFRCDGTGIFAKTGKICRKCGGTGRYHKLF